MTTTPKRCEPVAPIFWITEEDVRRATQEDDCVIACPHMDNAPSSAVYLYPASALEALQGEVQRLADALREANKGYVYELNRAHAFAADSRRYRYLRRKAGFVGNGDGTCSMQIINLPVRVIGWPEPDGIEPFIDAAIDNELTNLEPPTDGR